ncbi:GNAT family N-acetyltransferase [Streptomyces sp. NBC_01754]|uniref:GNAT family N-acetyltransferase n=1 Tax=Streptomyces sp. NBC_01754 TaxID=2975930 RepID=UPI002DDB7A2F|nr:GNAT family N-acetyltransferase [Streptomyces sp. NBC_01754]WSC93990.1 GNAT family N-acetyltransferase [Streptomyces sp. NBC_01754]
MVSATSGATVARVRDASSAVDLAAGPQGYVLRTATTEDVGGARAVMLDTVYHDLRSGYVPRWHADIIDLEGAYLRPERCTLLVVRHGDEVVATGAVRDRGPQSPPNPRWVADRFPSGSTAQLCRIYVRPEHRRHGLARSLVRELGVFAAGAGGYTSLYLHTDPAVPGAEPFWRSMAYEVCDERQLPGGGQGIVHFELPMPAPVGP